jgi:adenine deaminase
MPTPAALSHFFHQLPKVELHCHLLGTVRRSTFEQLAIAASAPISAQEIASFYTRGEKPVGVLRVLRALDAYLIRRPTDLHRLVYEYLQDAASHNVTYAEFFWNPTGTAERSGISYSLALEAIRQAIADALQDHQIVGRLIAAIDREASPQAALEMVQWVVQHPCDEVIGIGIDYRENERPPELFLEAYQLAQRSGLKTTAHAGEFGLPWPNIATALQVLKVDRLDHAYTIIDNPALVQECLEREMLITVVPTNSYYLRTLSPERWAAEHPIRQMLKLGLRLHPNTDDPTLHHVTPSAAWQMMHQHFDCDLAQVRQCMLNGLDGAWIDDSTRREWKKQFESGYAQCLANLAAS